MSKRKPGGFGETSRTILYAVLIAVGIRTVAFEPFKIPSGSMEPTLLVGDYLFVSKYSYGYSRYSLPLSLPLIPGRVLASAPERGDVVVFKKPTENKVDYIKRVVGLPGDVLQVVEGRLVINGEVLPREEIGKYRLVGERGGRTEITQPTMYLETLPGGVVHPILEESDNQMFDNTREFRVPEGHYFMMGDNRDHSADSRADVGYVPAVNLVGRAENLFYSIGNDAPFWEIWRWPADIRFERFFQEIK